MANRFSRKDPKVGEVSDGDLIIHRFLYEGGKYYVTKYAEDGRLLLWEYSGNKDIDTPDEQE